MGRGGFTGEVGLTNFLLQKGGSVFEQGGGSIEDLRYDGTLYECVVA